GPQVEFVAVTGTVQGLVETVTGLADRIGRAAPNALARAIVERHRSGARPDARESVERSRLGVAWSAERGRRQHRDGAQDQAPDAGENAGGPACVIAAMLPND